MSKKSVEVVIDVHEPPEITGAIDSHPDVEHYSFAELPAADIEVEGIGFERKTVSDYINSLKKGRIDSQTRKLAQRYEVAYILIDGDTSETENPFKSSMDGGSVRGSWASLTAREDSGVHSVIPCSNPALLADTAIRHARKHIEESDREFIPTDATEPDAPTALKMYMQIDGVGPSMAQTLYDEFPTIQDFVVKGNYETLQDLDGIGEKTAITIIDAFV